VPKRARARRLTADQLAARVDALAKKTGCSRLIHLSPDCPDCTREGRTPLIVLELVPPPAPKPFEGPAYEPEEEDFR
jgi:hypothetical protein